jgi:hypothetical protein
VALAAEAEDAALHGNMKNFYNTKKKAFWDVFQVRGECKRQRGQDHSEREEGQENRWKQHFEDILNRPAS